MTIEERAEFLVGQLRGRRIIYGPFGEAPIVDESICDDAQALETALYELRAHEAETIERCAKIAYNDQPRTIYYSEIDVLETQECIAARKQIAASIRALESS